MQKLATVTLKRILLRLATMFREFHKVSWSLVASKWESSAYLYSIFSILFFSIRIQTSSPCIPNTLHFFFESLRLTRLWVKTIVMQLYVHKLIQILSCFIVVFFALLFFDEKYWNTESKFWVCKYLLNWNWRKNLRDNYFNIKF